MKVPFLLAIAVLMLAGSVSHARTHAPEDSMDSVKGVAISPRIPCDGSTNFQEEVHLRVAFSPGASERSFHLDEFEAQYCKDVDLYFWCLKRGHDRWKNEWSTASSHPNATTRYWMDSCAIHGEKDPPRYILSGWYQDGAANPKQPWKQAVVKRVSQSPEVYEFTDAQGGTARVTIERK